MIKWWISRIRKNIKRTDCRIFHTIWFHMLTTDVLFTGLKCFDVLRKTFETQNDDIQITCYAVRPGKWCSRCNRNKLDSISRHCSWIAHYNDVIMSIMESQITSRTIVCSNIYSGPDQRKHQSSAALTFVRGIQRGLVTSPHTGTVTRKMFPFDDAIMVHVLQCEHYSGVIDLQSFITAMKSKQWSYS